MNSIGDVTRAKGGKGHLRSALGRRSLEGGRGRGGKGNNPKYYHLLKSASRREKGKVLLTWGRCKRERKGSLDYTLVVKGEGCQRSPFPKTIRGSGETAKESSPWSSSSKRRRGENVRGRPSVTSLKTEK